MKWKRLKLIISSCSLIILGHCFSFSKVHITFQLTSETNEIFRIPMLKNRRYKRSNSKCLSLNFILDQLFEDRSEFRETRLISIVTFTSFPIDATVER